MSTVTWIALLVVALALFLAWRRRGGAAAAPHREPGHAPGGHESATVRMPFGDRIDFGVTRIGERYGRPPDGRLLAWLDVERNGLHLAPGAADRAKNHFDVTEDGGFYWRVRTRDGETSYTVVELAAADYDRVIVAGDAFLVRDAKCVPYAKDTCLNFYDENRIFTYSWKAEDDTALCAWHDGEECKEIPRTNPVTLFPQRDCQGTSYQANPTWDFCSPA